MNVRHLIPALPIKFLETQAYLLLLLKFPLGGNWVKCLILLA